MEAVRVLLVCDHQVTSFGLERLVRSERRLELVGSVRADARALALARSERPDVIVLDLPSADADRVTTLAGEIRAGAPAASLILHCEAERAEVLAIAERVQAHGVLAKGDELREVLRAILMVARGMAYTSPRLVGLVPAEPQNTLSERQTQILQMLADGLETEEIATALKLSPETIKTHLKTISAKLGARGRTDAVARGVRLGIIR